ncbi:MAG: SDR family oxidoreductase [Mesorhizobium sp.]|uniref:SDR family oxidoreductase n=1 Tax=Mesorhizobium sp. TaxID=1871066 RepID=UPI000FE66B1E|nr:SDR family NAD(P)-dependent oxidoreductase [Mesorhizobium sp.]RWI50286.1 MAG: SDR family oxidoreductase [Mesorhizobium sp.]
MRQDRQKVALVTGAAGSLGFAASENLARAGHHVVMLDIADSIDDQAAELSRKGLSVAALAANLADEESLIPAIRAASADNGGFDILVNIAGISLRRNGQKVPAVDIPLEDWNTIMAVNLTSVFLLVREIVPGMVERKWGRVINMSSVGGRTGCTVNGIHYCATKAAIIGLSRTLAVEVAKANVTVNVVAPGRIETAINKAEGTAAEFIDKYIPVGRLGTPEDVAAAIGFLASDGASYMTGAVLDINGGWFMTP